MVIKVNLRKKSISGNRHSYYLDFYPPINHPKTGELTRREFLGIYIYDKPKTQAEKQSNKENQVLAEQIRQKRDNELNKPEVYNEFEKQQLRIKEKGEKSFLDFFKLLADKRRAGTHDNWSSCYNYLYAYSNGSIKFNEISEQYCEGFREYLLKTNSLKNKNSKLAQNSAVSYFNKFKAALKQAFKEDYLQVNINDRIDPIESGDAIKNTLTVDELNLLAKTECPSPLLRKAALFSALTGLPFKEMENLEWGHIEVTKDYGIRLEMIRQKTGKPYKIHISLQSYELLGEPQKPDDKVFGGLDNQDRYHYFPLWLAAAGIKKKLTFHDLRHSYGTNQIEAGTDIYTLKSNMGHSDVKYTQMYAHESEKRKKEAASKITLDL
ncbi:site-specific integrase [Candidatus Nomurabacteria bacterium]|nr:site-specific integrase [Candidatus Nomurabacteria bacterium]